MLAAMKHKRLWVFVGLMALVLVLNARFGWSRLLTDPASLPALRETLEEHFFLALLLYMVITTVGCVLLALPGVTFAIAAGVLFGPVWGTLACALAATVGACAAFLAGRYFLKDAVKPMLERSPLLRRLLFEGAGKSDIYLLMVTRLVPLFPYNLQNFAYGVTDIRFSRYALYSALFMLPGTAVYTVGAAGLSDARHRGPYLVFAVGLFVVVLLLSLFLKRRVLEQDAP